MPSAGMHGFHTKLYFAAYGTGDPVGVDPAGAGFTLISEVISINGVPMQSSVTRLTHLNSDDRAHEKIPGILDAGQINLKLNFTAAGIAEIFGDMLPDTVDDTADHNRLQWVIQFPSGTQWYCTGFVQGTPFDVPEDDRITVDLTIEISGRPNLTQ